MNGEMDVKMSCIKFMLFISNFMFVMIGFLLIAIGATVNSIYYDFELFMENHHFKPAELLIAIGVIIFLVSLFGCIGAVKESTALINIYAIFLFLIFILEISAAIAAYSMRGNIYHYVETNMNATLYEYPTVEVSKEFWDFSQERLFCCGIYGPKDWKNVTFVNGTYISSIDTTVTKSCTFKDREGNTNYWNQGCLRKLSNIARSSALMLGIGCTCIAFVQLLGVIFAVSLAKTVRRIKTSEEVKRQENRMRIYEQLQLSRAAEEKITPVLYTPTSTDA